MRVRLTRALGRALLALASSATILSGPQAASASPETCVTPAGPPFGTYICDYEPTIIEWPDGHRQWFVVGTDVSNQVWTSWEYAYDRWTNWEPLGGTARSEVICVTCVETNPYAPLHQLYDNHLAIEVVGTTGRFYELDWWPGG
ncbi:MAG: hypothetical protein HOV77_21650 [Hamadaea sp.]|uniref:hypothetical protein n=1 Tax=Hamadaea sp. TaxID=2024425 RepID=UPI00179016DF|nr:hypothetical protein [Hamadaea sp.]NUT21788.1 hypothetical protein [Hamadaea sp.]